MQKGISKRKKSSTTLLGHLMTLLVILSSAGCVWPFSAVESTPNPKLQWEAFDSIGRQGIRENTTLDELQGTYKGKLLYAIPADPQSITTLSTDDSNLIDQLSDGEMDLKGRIDGSQLVLAVILPDGTFLELDGLPPFELEEGIMTAPATTQAFTDDSYFSMICMVKVYPESLMLDGILRQEIQLSENNHILMNFHFQMIHEK